MIILGVDPGSLRTGYGAIETDGRRHRLVEKGVLLPPAPTTASRP
jgi:Holliday junction resolvasome RuvABC endonuclease subunit